MTVPQATRIEVPVGDGTLVAYRLGTAGDDVPVVLGLHGITANAFNWLAVAKALGDRATIVAPDLRGRGDSAELGPPFGMDAHAADVIALMDALGLERPVVAGHSMGAFVACRLATAHRERVDSLVLVDGGLPVPGADQIDPKVLIEQILGPAIARLRTTFPDAATYRAWWDQHPAMAGSDIEPEVLDAYVAHDTSGEPPDVRSPVNPQVVADDGTEVIGCTDARELTLPATALVAPRGMLDDPNPIQPMPVVKAWVDADPERRRGRLVADVNHYTIALGAAGAKVVAGEIAAAL